MKMNKNTMIDSTSDFFQLLNTVKWEAESLKTAGGKLELTTTPLKINANSDKGATRKDAEDAIAAAQDILEDIIYRARLTKSMLDNYKKLF